MQLYISRSSQVSVRWGFQHTDPDSQYNVTEFSIPGDGIVELRFDTPLSQDADILGIEATYKELTRQV